MYRIVKVLNHNAVLAVNAEDGKECLLMGKGIGFGKGERTCGTGRGCPYLYTAGIR